MKKNMYRIILTWMCVYPIVTLLLLALTSLGFELPLWQQTLAMTAVLVPIMVLIIGPKVGMVLGRVVP